MPANFRVFKQVPLIIFGEGALERLGEVLPPRKPGYVLVIDAVLKNKGVAERIKPEPADKVIWFDASKKEPSTAQVDEIRDQLAGNGGLPSAIVGIGGGS